MKPDQKFENYQTPRWAHTSNTEFAQKIAFVSSVNGEREWFALLTPGISDFLLPTTVYPYSIGVKSDINKWGKKFRIFPKQEIFDCYIDVSQGTAFSWEIARYSASIVTHIEMVYFITSAHTPE